jgi:hypothetical protein
LFGRIFVPFFEDRESMVLGLTYAYVNSPTVVGDLDRTSMYYVKLTVIIARCPTDFSNQWLEHLSYRRALGFELREDFRRLAGKDSNIRPLTRSCGVILTWHCYRYLTSNEVSALRLVLRITLSYICFKS